MMLSPADHKRDHNSKRYRTYFLSIKICFGGTMTLIYLVLLTIVVLATSGSGFWLGRSSPTGVSYPFVLQVCMLCGSNRCERS